MTFRFCLYGFLKNQRYYEPFLVLFLMEKGLSFFWIGLLIAWQELWVQVLEVPSGAMADLYGRRRSMIFAWCVYLVAFCLFALAGSVWGLAAAMACLATADAFRSGTHKAMIFDWLESQGRQNEKARFYGMTRSWSQIGSAVSVCIAAAIVVLTQRYEPVFWWAMVPYVLGLLNFFGYPASLDGAVQAKARPKVWDHLRRAFRACWTRRPLRLLLTESMLQRGHHSAVKPYLQPLLEQSAQLLPLALGLAVLGDQGRIALLVALVYGGLHLGSALASRQAHRVQIWGGGPGTTARHIAAVTWVLFMVLTAALWLGRGEPAAATGGKMVFSASIAVGIFVLLALLQNLWKPLFIARVDDASEADMGATLFSIDSQTKSLFIIWAAPLLGWLVDALGLVAVGGFGALTAALAWTAVRMGTLRVQDPAS